MSEKNKQIDLLKDKLENRNQEALMEIEARLAQIKLDIKIKEKGQAVINQFHNLAEQEIRTLTERILAMRDKQGLEQNSLETRHLEEQHKILINSLIKRIQLAISMGNTDIAELGKSFALLDSARSGADGIGGTEVAKTFPTDLLTVTDKLKTGKELDEAEMKTLEGLMRKVATLKIDNPREALMDSNKFAGMVILSELEPAQRMSVLKKIEDERLFHKMLINFVATGYLSVAQGLQLLDEAAEKHPDLQKHYADARAEIDSDGMRRFQLEVEKLRKHALKSLDRNLHQNYAGKYLNPETYLTVKAGQTLGAMTLIGNFLANVNPFDLFKNPPKFFKDVAGLAVNPAFLLGLGVTGATVEYVSGGFGKGWLTQAIHKLTDDKSLKVEEIEKRKKEQMWTVLNNYPEVTEFYFKNAAKIIAMKKDGKSITVANMKAEGIEIPHFKNTSMQTFTDNLPQFAAVLEDDKQGFALHDAATQRRFINNGRTNQGLQILTE